MSASRVRALARWAPILSCALALPVAAQSPPPEPAPGGNPVLARPPASPGPVAPGPVVGGVSQVADLVVRRDPSNRKKVLTGRLSGGTVASLYTTRLDAVRNLKLSVDEKFVAVLEAKEGVITDGEYTTLPSNRLAVLDARGRKRCEEQLRLEDVYRYSFSPDAKRIAALTGTYYEGGEGFRPAGGFTLDIPTCRKAPISTKATELNWISARPNSILLQTFERNQTVHELDLQTGRAVPTSYLSTDLSPDGRFYLIKPSTAVRKGLCDPEAATDDCFRLIDAATHRPTSVSGEVQLGRHTNWVTTQGHLLLHRKGTAAAPKALVYDVERKQVVKRIEGPTLSDASTGSWVASPRFLVAPVRPLPARIGDRLRPELLRQIPLERVELEAPEEGIRELAPERVGP